ncbi:MAG: sulfite exporter TauE/SafE family protein [Euryarchaeota archaeon]|nr:sulfite exporter TauE/SafE family protein [Euryarchaeota archaeon]
MDAIPALMLFLVGFFAQYVYGALGMGFGVTASSVLLTLSLQPIIISTLIHVMKAMVGIPSIISHWKAGNIRGQLPLVLGAFGVLGGIIGAFLLISIPGSKIMLFGIKILVKELQNKNTFNKRKTGLLKLGVVGFIGGLLDAIGGGGWGPICTPALISWAYDQPRYVVGSVNLAGTLVSAVVAGLLIVKINLERSFWKVIIPFIIGAFFAAPIAAYTAKRLSARYMIIIIGVFLVLTNAKTLIGTLSAYVSRSISYATAAAALMAILVYITILTHRHRRIYVRGR